ncbi:unnamed protein product [Ectocarpus sp. 13 AM-2016]
MPPSESTQSPTSPSSRASCLQARALLGVSLGQRRRARATGCCRRCSAGASAAPAGAGSPDEAVRERRRWMPGVGPSP